MSVKIPPYQTVLTLTDFSGLSLSTRPGLEASQLRSLEISSPNAKFAIISSQILGLATTHVHRGA